MTVLVCFRKEYTQFATIQGVVDSKEDKPGCALSAAKQSNSVMNKCFQWMSGGNDKGQKDGSTTWLSQKGNGSGSGGRLAMLSNRWPLLLRPVLLACHGGESDPAEKAAILVASEFLLLELGDDIIKHEKLPVGSDLAQRVKEITLGSLTGIDPETLSKMVIYSLCLFAFLDWPRPFQINFLREKCHDICYVSILNFQHGSEVCRRIVFQDNRRIFYKSLLNIN